jgi:hypothetical protein
VFVRETRPRASDSGLRHARGRCEQPRRALSQPADFFACPSSRRPLSGRRAADAMLLKMAIRVKVFAFLSGDAAFSACHGPELQTMTPQVRAVSPRCQRTLVTYSYRSRLGAATVMRILPNIV